jgi:hypothetical protein
MNLETEEHFVFVGQIADDTPQRRRQLFDQCRGRKNSIVLRHLRLLEDVDDFELVSASEILIANAPQIGDGHLRSRIRSGHVQLE